MRVSDCHVTMFDYRRGYRIHFTMTVASRGVESSMSVCFCPVFLPNHPAIPETNHQQSPPTQRSTAVEYVSNCTQDGRHISGPEAKTINTPPSEGVKLSKSPLHWSPFTAMCPGCFWRRGGVVARTGASCPVQRCDQQGCRC